MALRGSNWFIPCDEPLVPVHLSFWTAALRACADTGKEPGLGDAPFQLADSHPGCLRALPCGEAAAVCGGRAPCAMLRVTRVLLVQLATDCFRPRAEYGLQSGWFVGIQRAVFCRTCQEMFHGFACHCEEELAWLLQFGQLFSGKAYRSGGAIFLKKENTFEALRKQELYFSRFLLLTR